MPSPRLPVEVRRKIPSIVAIHEPMDKYRSKEQQHQEWRLGTVKGETKGSLLRENMFAGNRVANRKTRRFGLDTWQDPGFLIGEISFS
jgi:hypothetical protein